MGGWGIEIIDWPCFCPEHICLGRRMGVCVSTAAMSCPFFSATPTYLPNIKTLLHDSTVTDKQSRIASNDSTFDPNNLDSK